MEDLIKIDDLLLRCIVGINEWEKREKQDIVISVTLAGDFKRAGRTDDIKDTVDYKALKKEIIDLVENNTFSLIEKIAYEIAEICIVKSGVKRVEIKVDKPGALRFARNVSVLIRREWSDVILGIGSNIKPEENIPLALELLKRIKGVEFEKVTKFYETLPIDQHGNVDRTQPNFLNGAVKIRSYLSYEELLANLENIEVKLGRIKKEGGKFSPRQIDLDILVWINSSGKVTYVHHDLFSKDFIPGMIYPLLDRCPVELMDFIYLKKDRINNFKVSTLTLQQES